MLPEVPSVAELGYPELVETVWRVISAPKETPRDVVEYIESVIEKAVAMPNYRAEAEAAGIFQAALAA